MNSYNLKAQHHYENRVQQVQMCCFFLSFFLSYSFIANNSTARRETVALTLGHIRCSLFLTQAAFMTCHLVFWGQWHYVMFMFLPFMEPVTWKTAWLMLSLMNNVIDIAFTAILFCVSRVLRRGRRERLDYELGLREFDRAMVLWRL